MAKIAIIGADGQLGSDLLKVIPLAIPLTIKDIDITDIEQVERVLSKVEPETVINTAAYHNVDECENNPAPAFKVNAVGAGNIAKVCLKLNAKLVHISTDYVFAGDKSSPYFEDDIPKPRTAYGVSKLAGEEMIQYILPQRHYIIRSSGLFGAKGCVGKGGTNFVEGMIKRANSGQPIKVVNDEIVGPTYTYDLALKIGELIGKANNGLYHITNSGQCSWHEFALEIFRQLNLKVDISPTNSVEFITKAKRPAYSVLGHKNLLAAGLKALRPWQEALRAYLVERRYLCET